MNYIKPSGTMREARSGKTARREADCALVQKELTSSFEKLRRTLTQHRLTAIEDLRHVEQVRWAAEEASSLAWVTGFPLLLFPALFEECAAAALERARRQEWIHQRSRELLESTNAGTLL